jgi:hypothetical protein
MGWQPPDVVPQVVIGGSTNSGLLAYSGKPALGNLIASIKSAAGFDQYGNEYLAGNVGYTFIMAEPAYYGVVSSANGVSVFRATSAGGPWTQMGGLAYLHGGFAGMQLYDQASGASLTAGDVIDAGGNVYDQLVGVLSMAPAVGAITIPATLASNGNLYASTVGTPSAVLPSGFTGSLVISQADHGTGTANTTGFQNLTKIWTINANDPQVNTGYRLTAGGTIAAGTSVQVLTFCLNTYSNTSIQLPIGSAEFLASTSYWWSAQGEVTWNAVGASTGQFTGSLRVAIGVSGGNQATVAGTAQTAGGFAGYGQSAASINTTASSSMALQAKWGATTGGPTITGDYSIFERLGT